MCEGGKRNERAIQSDHALSIGEVQVVVAQD